jgi:hypothetical protein
MQSITYCRIRLVNRKMAIVSKMTLHVGIRAEWEVGEYVQYPFLVILLCSVILMQRVLRYTRCNHFEEVELLQKLNDVNFVLK